MIDISVSGLSKEFEVGKKILDKLSFQVESGERVGLLGKNGAGKTTLFHLLVGTLDSDEGSVTLAPGKRVGLISQIPVFPAGHTVEQVLLGAFDRLRAAEAELCALSEQMAHDDDRALLRRYDELLALLETQGGYSTETELNKVCNGLQIPKAMRDQAFDDLSGGERTRVNLARLILEDTDILLLDEPTNHLDIRACEWLEDYLNHYRGTVLCISHDRYFLDRVIDRVIELVDGGAELYAGNYSFYAVEKEARYQEQLARYEKEQSKAAQLREAADRLRIWAASGDNKQYYRQAASMEKRIERIAVTRRPKRERGMNTRFGESDFRGDDLLMIRDLAKGYDGRTLFSDVTLELTGGERVALLGDNGTGKSTLLRLLTDREPPDAGRIKLGPTVKIGFLPQIVVFDHPERNLLDTMLYELNCSTQEARNRLASFRFRGEDVFKSVSALSGGERSRLMLCILMAAHINLLILDEPTNHLDAESREWIEEALEEYGGALLFVSHDRYFISRFAERVWEIDRCVISDFEGSYEDYRAERARRAAGAAPVLPPKRERPVRTGGTKLLSKQAAAAERAVDDAEVRFMQLELEIAKHATDYQRLERLYAERELLETELQSLLAQWESLARELEQA